MTKRQEIRVADLAEPLSHYTDVVVHGDLAFISGCIAVNADGKLVGAGDVVTQTRVCLENLAKALAAAGSGFEDVLKVTVYLTDINARTSINPVRVEFFGDSRPASTLVQICALAVKGAEVEIEAVAAIRG
jgi:2-iminobutanoate/2-iminopropanoate deaminase